LNILEEMMNTVDEKDWTKENLEKVIKERIDKDNLGNGDTLWPMRVAMTGLGNSPGTFEVAAVLGKDESISRIKKAIEKI